jgi:hypothetical protein
VRRAWKISIGLVVLFAVLLIIADRVGAMAVERVAESRLAQNAPFAGSPSVVVHGVPFITQAVRGRYDDIEVSGRLSTLGAISGPALDVHLRGVQLPLGQLVRGDVQEVPVEAAEGTVSIPYSEVARLAEIPGLTLTPNGSRLDASAVVTVPMLGGQVRVTGAAALDLVDGQIRVHISELQAGSVSLPATVLPALSTAATALIPVPDLPYGLRLTSVRPGLAGLLVGGTGRNVVSHRLP